MKISALLFLLLIPLTQAAARPNVLIIYTDDHDSLDMGCYGAKDLETPAISQDPSEKTNLTEKHPETKENTCPLETNTLNRSIWRPS